MSSVISFPQSWISVIVRYMFLFHSHLNLPDLIFPGSRHFWELSKSMSIDLSWLTNRSGIDGVFQDHIVIMKKVIVINEGFLITIASQ